MKKILIVAVLTFFASIIAQHVKNIEELKNEALFEMPMEIANWRGRKVLMEDWVFESLQTPYAIMRDYRSAKDKKLNLAIVWYDDKEIAFHAPEACLGGVGNTVTAKRTYKLKILDHGEYDIGELIVNQNSRSQLVLYYFITDGFITPSQVKLRGEILKKRFQFKRTSAALVRIMADIEADPTETRQLLKTFLQVSFPVINDYTHTKNIIEQLHPPAAVM